MTIAITLLSALIIYVIFRQVRRAKADKALIEFKIGTTDGFYYNIAREKVPIEMDANERIRIMLGFISQLLSYTTSKRNPEQNDILKFIKEVSQKELSQDAIVQYFKREFAFELEAREAKVEGKVIIGRLFKEGNDRRFHVSIPPDIFKYQLLFSSASLLHLALGKLDTCQKAHLQQSLKYIVDTYLNLNTDSSTIPNLENLAYQAGKTTTEHAELQFG